MSYWKLLGYKTQDEEIEDKIRSLLKEVRSDYKNKAKINRGKELEEFELTVKKIFLRKINGQSQKKCPNIKAHKNPKTGNIVFVKSYPNGKHRFVSDDT